MSIPISSATPVAVLPFLRICSAVCVLISSKYLLLLLGMVSSYLFHPFDSIRNHCHFSIAVQLPINRPFPSRRSSIESVLTCVHRRYWGVFPLVLSYSSQYFSTTVYNPVLPLFSLFAIVHIIFYIFEDFLQQFKSRPHCERHFKYSYRKFFAKPIGMGNNLAGRFTFNIFFSNSNTYCVNDGSHGTKDRDSFVFLSYNSCKPLLNSVYRL